VTAAAATASIAAAPTARRRLDRDDLLMRGGICLFVLWLLVTLALPLWALLSKSFQNQDGKFIGLANYYQYFSTPALFDSVWNSLFVSFASTVIVLPLAFVYAYALQRSCMRWKGLFQAVALIPILAPSLLPAISFIYLFGNQGCSRAAVRGLDLRRRRHHRFAGLLLFPGVPDDPRRRAVDGRCAPVRGRGRAWAPRRRACSSPVTLPGAKYGVMSAAFVGLHARHHRLRHRESDRREGSTCSRPTSTSR
jgi:iron(III) transport system permease protein